MINQNRCKHYVCSLAEGILSVLFLLFAGVLQAQNLERDGEWLYFDNLKPNEVLQQYGNTLTISGESMDPEQNCRVAIWKQGAVVIPHARDYKPLTVYSERGLQGNSEQMGCTLFYTNRPPQLAPASAVSPLELDNQIRSLRLSKGYMMTLATEPDGMGMSQVFVADTGDLIIDSLSVLLDRKISYVRVMPWQYVSKKGWAGSKWTSVPEGLKYVEEQCDATNSTWYYNWSTTTDWTTNPNRTGKSYNQDFVPEIWGTGRISDGIYTLENVSHLLGYNEPDHSEQSNVSVEDAIAEWPMLMQTGLRLGSPATTDFTWLYNFMREAKTRNYRVDYVVVHAYWGGLGPQDWYNKLKTVHETTGRPIWIKEWNNGANWTKESWPSGTADQQAKQLSDLKGILAIMDTCSFIERYSIYNWVEDKRAMILSTGALTPAGEYYRDDQPDYFFRHDQQFQPTYAVRTAPVLSYSELQDKHLKVTWTDDCIELIDTYVVEVSQDGSTWTEVGRYGNDTQQCQISLSNIEGTQLMVRVCSLPVSGSKQTSNILTLNILNNSGVGDGYTTRMQVSENWMPALLTEPLSERPIVMAGPATYRNKLPLTLRLKQVTGGSFDFALRTWDYQLSPSLAYGDTLDIMTLRPGRYDWQGVQAEAGQIDGLGSQWQQVHFSQPFDVTPVVIPTQVSDNFASASSPRVRNVTTEGFEVQLQYEGMLQNDSVPETIDWVAVTPGEGRLNGRAIVVGQTADETVQDNLLGGTEVSYGQTFLSVPYCFAAMQTETDTITADLRIKSRGLQSFTLIKDREKSVAHERVTGERVGFILVGDTQATPVANVEIEEMGSRLFDLSGRMLAEPPHRGIYLQKKGTKINKIIKSNQQ